MRVVRALQERTGGFTEFVPLSFIPFHTLLGRTHGVEEISREENLKHTAVFRLALGRSVPSLQASWVKMGLDAATEALRWGVNDLGGTLMEESISRMAGSYHGVRLEPADLIAAAHARRPPGRRAHDALRDPAALRAGGRRVTQLVLGPALRYAGETEAIDLGRDRRAVHGLRARLRGEDVLRRGPPLRARASATGLEPGTITPYEVTLDGETVWPLPDSEFPPSVIRTHDPSRPTKIVFGSCRVCAPHEPPHSLPKDEHPDGREVDALNALVQRMRGAGPVGVAGGADPARRPGLRRRGLAGRARLHPLAPRPGGAAGGDRRRLRGVHAPVLGVVGRALHALAALDGALVDDLRRPRRPRRLEHVEGLGRGDPRAGLVGRADLRRLHVLLALPAPRQPVAARARRARPLPPRARGRGRERDPARLRVQGRPRGQGHALELLPRHRPGAARDGRLARRPGARPGRAQHGRRGRVGRGSRSTRAATATTC